MNIENIVPIIFRHASNKLSFVIPALFTRTKTEPYFCSISVTSASIASPFRTSSTAPAPFSAKLSVSFCAFRSRQLQNRLDGLLCIAAPMPRLAPVTNATFRCCVMQFPSATNTAFRASSTCFAINRKCFICIRYPLRKITRQSLVHTQPHTEYLDLVDIASSWSIALIRTIEPLKPDATEQHLSRFPR